MPIWVVRVSVCCAGYWLGLLMVVFGYYDSCLFGFGFICLVVYYDISFRFESFVCFGSLFCLFGFGFLFMTVKLVSY